MYMYLFTTSQLGERPQYNGQCEGAIYRASYFRLSYKKELMPGTSLHLSGHAFEAPISCVATSCRAKHVLLDLAISLCSCDLAVLRVL